MSAQLDTTFDIGLDSFNRLPRTGYWKSIADSKTFRVIQQFALGVWKTRGTDVRPWLNQSDCEVVDRFLSVYTEEQAMMVIRQAFDVHGGMDADPRLGVFSINTLFYIKDQGGSMEWFARKLIGEYEMAHLMTPEKAYAKSVVDGWVNPFASAVA